MPSRCAPGQLYLSFTCFLSYTSVIRKWIRCWTWGFLSLYVGGLGLSGFLPYSRVIYTRHLEKRIVFIFQIQETSQWWPSSGTFHPWWGLGLSGFLAYSRVIYTRHLEKRIVFIFQIQETSQWWPSGTFHLWWGLGLSGFLAYSRVIYTRHFEKRIVFIFQIQKTSQWWPSSSTFHPWRWGLCIPLKQWESVRLILSITT